MGNYFESPGDWVKIQKRVVSISVAVVVDSHPSGYSCGGKSALDSRNTDKYLKNTRFPLEELSISISKCTNFTRTSTLHNIELRCKWLSRLRKMCFSKLWVVQIDKLGSESFRKEKYETNFESFMRKLRGIHELSNFFVARPTQTSLRCHFHKLNANSFSFQSFSSVAFLYKFAVNFKFSSSQVPIGTTPSKSQT
jgi:hypothetical protein